MKKVWRMLLLAGVFTVLLCVSALAAGEGMYDVSEKLIPDVSTTEKVTIGGELKDVYVGAEKVTLTYGSAKPGSYYLVMLLDDSVVPTVSKIEAGDIAYIDQKPAEGTGETSTVEFTVYPNKLENGKTYKVYLSSNDGALSTLTEQGSFSYYVPYKLGDSNGDDVVDVTDAVKILKCIVGNDSFSGSQGTAADANGDGVVDVTDAVTILKYIVGNGTLGKQ